MDFYSESREYLESMVLETGDVTLLACGGHGFEMLEATGMIEMKRGRCAGGSNKTRFGGVESKEVRLPKC